MPLFGIASSLGGSEQVCYNTAKYLAERWGVRSYFFACEFAPHALNILQDLACEAIYLPEDNHEHRFMTANNWAVLRSAIKQRGIELLFFSSAENVDLQLRKSLDCQLVLWHHCVPLGECQEKLLRAKSKAERSLGAWLEYQFVIRPKFEYSSIRRAKIEQSYRQSLECFDYYLVLCPEYAERLIADLQLPPEQAQKIRPMINTQPERLSPQLGKSREVIYMGRLDRGQKCVDRLLRIWQRVQARLPEWRLRIYGSGAEEGYLKKLAQRLGLERCSFEGRVQYPDVAYSSASVLCMTSNYEGFPLAMVEAQCHGVVPMAFDVCAGIRYVVAPSRSADADKCDDTNKPQSEVPYHKQAGILVPAFDLDAYADELLRLCQDEVYRAELQQACLAKVKDYAPTVNDTEWLAILA